MKVPLCLSVLLLGISRIWASTQCPQVTVQPIHASTEAPDRKWWGPVEYKILDVPFLNCSYYGYPPYAAISQSHPILHNGNEHVGDLECNLLSLLGIRISHDPSGSPQEVLVNLEGAKKADGVTTGIEEAVNVALECIRIVSNRYHGHAVKVVIIAPKGGGHDWKSVEERFNGHDMTKPFITKGGRTHAAEDAGEKRE